MAISDSDILLKLSITTGSAGNSQAQTDVNTSLGKYISTTELTSNSLHNLFDAISGLENALNDIEYRCIFIHNAHATLTYYGCVVYLSSEVSGGASISIGLDTTSASSLNSVTDQALTIADESTAPTGVTFSSPTSVGSGLSIGDLSPGTVKAIWIKRTAANTAAKNNDGVTLSIIGDTAE